jgi:hypothetical protein
VTGIHRSRTTQSSVASARKSAAWLLQLAGAVTAILVQLAVVAYVAYTLITQPSEAWLHAIAIATALTVCLGALGLFVSRRMDRAESSK